VRRETLRRRANRIRTLVRRSGLQKGSRGMLEHRGCPRVLMVPMVALALFSACSGSPSRPSAGAGGSCDVPRSDASDASAFTAASQVDAGGRSSSEVSQAHSSVGSAQQMECDPDGGTAPAANDGCNGAVCRGGRWEITLKACNNGCPRLDGPIRPPTVWTRVGKVCCHYSSGALIPKKLPKFATEQECTTRVGAPGLP
jgi:hypothetical protein